MKKFEKYPDWEIVEELGSGSYGKVYRVRKTEEFGGTTYSAVKVVSIPEDSSEIHGYRDDGYDDASISTIFKQRVEEIASEFQLLSRLRGNSHIVSYEDHKIVQQPSGMGWDIYIRMELLKTLPEYLNQRFPDGKIDEQTVIKVGIDICKALELCAKQDIIHRDIKPQNIFINDNG